MTREKLRHWEELAKLTLSEEERDRFETDLEGLLRFCEPLLAVPMGEDERGLPPKTREDLVGRCLSQEEILKGAPKTAEGMIAVPKTM
jgi:aspartyl/glutamyl-tRNA(Asn/Gln) amidotransferase C subunit